MTSVFWWLSIGGVVLVVGFLAGRWHGGNRRLPSLSLLDPMNICFEVVQEIRKRQYIVRPTNLRDGPNGPHMTDLYYFRLGFNGIHGFKKLKVGHHYSYQRYRRCSGCVVVPIGRSIADED